LGVLNYFEALLWNEKGKPVLARQWLEKGVRADPSFAPNFRLLARLRLQAGDQEAARRFDDRAASLEAR
jgi:Tfp pilus assembly protein PilF